MDEGAQIGGAAWSLSVLWVGIGAAASGYVFLVSTKTVLDPASPFVGIFDWPGGNWNTAAFAAAVLAGLTWLVLTIPVLITADWVSDSRRAGQAAHGSGVGGRVGLQGVALMALIPASVASTKTLVPPRGLRELVVDYRFLTLASVMAWILAGHSRTAAVSTKRSRTAVKYSNAPCYRRARPGSHSRPSSAKHPVTWLCK